MSRNAVEITTDEAIAALRAGAWTERVDAEYQRAREASGNALYLDVDGQVRDAPSFIDVPGNWRRLYVDVTPQGRKRIHCQMSFTGADWNLDQAIELVEKATKIAWVDHRLSHDLAVMAEGCAHYFDVQRPREQT
jgi:hypothetical protein